MANKADVPCANDESGLINPTDIGPLRLSVLSARTFANPEDIPGTYAEAEVLSAKLMSAGGIPEITAQVLRTSAEVTCAKGEPLFNSSSKVVYLRIGDQVIQVPENGDPMTLDLGPLGTIYINEKVETPTSITRRAFRLDSPLLDVVAAESSANVEGNPCGRKTPPPPPPPKGCGDDNGGKVAYSTDDDCPKGGGGNNPPPKHKPGCKGGKQYNSHGKNAKKSCKKHKKHNKHNNKGKKGAHKR